jgi:hypothetical protein
MRSRRNAASSLIAVGFVVLASIVPSSTAAAASALPPVCGVWVLEQVSGPWELNNMRPQLEAALATPGVRGLSVRAGWDAIDGDLSIFDRAYEIAQSAGKELSIRVMAGRYTPARVFTLGAYSYVDSNGDRIPKPFSSSGVPGNPVFEQQYRDMVSSLAAWSSNHGVRLLHLPWYGHLWAEIDNGPEIQGAAGYSTYAWTVGHLTLLSIGLAASNANLAVEFPMSGHWGNGSSQASNFFDLIVNSVGQWSSQVFVQGNGLGVYNSDPSWGRPIHSGIQMYDGNQYDWQAAFAHAASVQTTYVEVYTSSFTGNADGTLATASAGFNANFNGSCLYGPATPPTDTVAPDTTITSPKDGAKLRLTRLMIRGIATDDVGVSMVNVGIRNRVTGLWWRRDGTWGKYQAHRAKLSAPGGLSTGWHLRWRPASSGRFMIVVRAKDATGNKDPRAARASIRLKRKH